MAQLGRSDSPITATDAIPALLTEDPDTIRLCMKTMATREQGPMVRSEATKMLRAAIERGDFVPRAAEKLHALTAEVATA